MVESSGKDLDPGDDADIPFRSAIDCFPPSDLSVEEVDKDVRIEQKTQLMFPLGTNVLKVLICRNTVLLP